jgi:hypothetical protein
MLNKKRKYVRRRFVYRQLQRRFREVAAEHGVDVTLGESAYLKCRSLASEAERHLWPEDPRVYENFNCEDFFSAPEEKPVKGNGERRGKKSNAFLTDRFFTDTSLKDVLAGIRIKKGREKKIKADLFCQPLEKMIGRLSREKAKLKGLKKKIKPGIFKSFDKLFTQLINSLNRKKIKLENFIESLNCGATGDSFKQTVKLLRKEFERSEHLKAIAFNFYKEKISLLELDKLALNDRAQTADSIIKRNSELEAKIQSLENQLAEKETELSAAQTALGVIESAASPTKQAAALQASSPTKDSTAAFQKKKPNLFERTHEEAIGDSVLCSDILSLQGLATKEVKEDKMAERENIYLRANGQFFYAYLFFNRFIRHYRAKNLKHYLALREEKIKNPIVRAMYPENPESVYFFPG